MISIGVQVHVCLSGRCHITKYLLDPKTTMKLRRTNYSCVKSLYCSASAYQKFTSKTTNQNLHELHQMNLSSFWQAEENLVLTNCHALQSTGYYGGAAAITAALISKICNSNGGVAMVPKQGLRASLRMLFMAKWSTWAIFYLNQHRLMAIGHACWHSLTSFTHAVRASDLTQNFYACCMLEHLIWPRREHWGVRWPSGQKREAGSVGQRGERPEFGIVFFWVALSFNGPKP